MRTIIILVVIAVVAAIALSCFFVVDETEYTVQMRFGAPVKSIVDPGLYVKWPWPIDLLVRFDNRLLVLENPAPGQPDKEYLTKDESSGIGKNVMVTTYTCWRIKPSADAVLQFLQTMRDRASAEARLGDLVVSELGTALGNYDFAALVSTDPAARQWDKFLGDIRKVCADRVKDYGIEIVDIRIQRLNFPEQNRRNVFDRMRAERETIATRYRSEGLEKATVIRAEANREREEILAEAFEETEKVRGQADAEAASIYASAYGQDPEFYNFMRTLETYEKTLDDKTVAILSGTSEFLRLLNRTADEPLPVPASQPAGRE
ncbi:MAG: protease modulator HflC [Phycisphaerae bacterium]|nr:protease modulator HflC [Phycisphaerae bacterium]